MPASVSPGCWIVTRPASDMSPNSTLTTPSGIRISAATSATDFSSTHSSQMRWCSGSRPGRRDRPLSVVDTNASMGNW